VEGGRRRRANEATTSAAGEGDCRGDYVRGHPLYNRSPPPHPFFRSAVPGFFEKRMGSRVVRVLGGGAGVHRGQEGRRENLQRVREAGQRAGGKQPSKPERASPTRAPVARARPRGTTTKGTTTKGDIPTRPAFGGRTSPSLPSRDQPDVAGRGGGSGGPLPTTRTRPAFAAALFCPRYARRQPGRDPLSPQRFFALQPGRDPLSPQRFFALATLARAKQLRLSLG
jgi:hypothetical protein